MSLQIIVKNSAISGKEPTSGQLANGEIALNYHADGPFLSCKDTTGTVRRITGVWVNASAPSSPTPGELWLDISLTPPQLKTYQDSTNNWVAASTVYSASTAVAGVVELATDAETQAGSDANRAVTPASLQSKISDSVSTTSSSTIASSTAVKAAKDVADAALPKTGGTINGALQVTGNTTLDGAVICTGTSYLDIPAGTDQQRPQTANSGMIRYNTTISAFEGYSNGSWFPIGAVAPGAITNSEIAANAEIAVSKLADGAARQVLQTSSDGLGVEWTDSIDLPGTLDVTGTATFDGVVICGGTGYLDLPAGTDAQRPGSPNSGMVRYNTTSSAFEGYSNGKWGPLGATVTTDDVAPSNPIDGDLWYDSVGGRTYVYYNDGSSSQWVDASPQGPYGLTPADIGVTVQGYDADTAKLDVVQSWSAAQTFNAQANFGAGVYVAGSLVLEGTTVDDFEVTIAAEPTADRTITLPNATTTLAGLSVAQTWSGAQTFDGATVFNEAGGDVDLRMEGDTVTHLFFLDASTDRIGINQSAPATRLDLAGACSSNVTAVAALAIDCSLGNFFTKTVVGDSTFTVSNVPTSRSYSFCLRVTHTSGTITWFSGVIWPGGTAPTLTTGKVHLFFFDTEDGGTTWRASSLINYAS